MEIKTRADRRKMNRAKRRIAELKGFYWHLASYVAVNLFISILVISWHMRSGQHFLEAVSDFGAFAVWIFWGIGLASHAIKVFSLNIVFGKDWEARQIQKYMQEEREKAKKFN